MVAICCDTLLSCSAAFSHIHPPARSTCGLGRCSNTVIWFNMSLLALHRHNGLAWRSSGCGSRVISVLNSALWRGGVSHKRVLKTTLMCNWVGKKE
ncbi:uncharacterized protein YALI1_E28790g [Yarrowia lipolytica]|uniref:Uncharacterized protein n=1 Tax=Yarrowia lipolytica TaxID=4952 RepID=A0A1D8NJT6_YARLL|nr:hypothetical protein YALI1_E28790g [Yarrowia lipolytica]